MYICNVKYNKHHLFYLLIMKKKGSSCDYTSAKNAELVKTFNSLLRRSKMIDLDVIFREVAESEASRFFISEDRAYDLILTYRRDGIWKISNPLREEMMEEILARAEMFIDRYPGSSLKDAVCMAVNTRAPKFYLTPRSCRTIIYQTIKETYKTNRKHGNQWNR